VSTSVRSRTGAGWRAMASSERWGWFPRRERLAVVLSGGGALGAFQVGVIDVLARRGIEPDLLVGTSVGAVNAAYWAFKPGPDAGARLLRLWEGAGRHRVLPRGRLSAVQAFLRRQGCLGDNSGLRRVFADNLGPDARIEDSQIPLALVATDARTGERVVLRTGEAVPALLASAAIPGVFPPIAVGDRILVDGGIVANCDLEAAAEAGMTDVIAVDLVGTEQRVDALDMWERVAGTVRASLRRQTDLQLRALDGALRVAVLRPRLSSLGSLGDFSATIALFSCGRALADRFLREHLSGRRVRPGVREMNALAIADAGGAGADAHRPRADGRVPRGPGEFRLSRSGRGRFRPSPLPEA
jgi:NTE family protein